MAKRPKHINSDEASLYFDWIMAVKRCRSATFHQYNVDCRIDTNIKKTRN